MNQKIEKILNKWSMKYKQLHATDDDIIIEASDFQNISQDIIKLFNKSQVNWVSISEQMPPLHNYVLLVNETGYMEIDFIHEYDLTTEKYPKNYTHWANLPEKPSE